MCYISPVDGSHLSCRTEAEKIFTSCKTSKTNVFAHAADHLLALEDKHGQLPVAFKKRVLDIVRNLRNATEILTRYMTAWEKKQKEIEDMMADAALGLSGKNPVAMRMSF